MTRVLAVFAVIVLVAVAFALGMCAEDQLTQEHEKQAASCQIAP